jgi:hypothetical protein
MDDQRVDRKSDSISGVKAALALVVVALIFPLAVPVFLCFLVAETYEWAKRRRWQFTIREALAGMAICAILFACAKPIASWLIDVATGWNDF